MKIGDKIRDRLDESIRLRDKLLLILSETSVSSQWVEQEVETALEEERKRGKTVLFPVRLDDTVFSVDKGWPNLLKNSRHIGDFTDWKNHDSYQQAADSQSPIRPPAARPEGGVAAVLDGHPPRKRFPLRVDFPRAQSVE